MLSEQTHLYNRKIDVLKVFIQGKRRYRICMSVDKNYFALLSVTYNTQSCTVASVESACDNADRSPL